MPPSADYVIKERYHWWRVKHFAVTFWHFLKAVLPSTLQAQVLASSDNRMLYNQQIHKGAAGVDMDLSPLYKVQHLLSRLGVLAVNKQCMP